MQLYSSNQCRYLSVQVLFSSREMPRCFLFYFVSMNARLFDNEIRNSDSFDDKNTGGVSHCQFDCLPLSELCNHDHSGSCSLVEHDPSDRKRLRTVPSLRWKFEIVPCSDDRVTRRFASPRSSLQDALELLVAAHLRTNDLLDKVHSSVGVADQMNFDHPGLLRIRQAITHELTRNPYDTNWSPEDKPRIPSSPQIDTFLLVE